MDPRVDPNTNNDDRPQQATGPATVEVSDNSPVPEESSLGASKGNVNTQATTSQSRNNGEKDADNDRGLEDPPVSTQTGKSDPNASSQNYYENGGFDDCNVPDSDLNVGAGDSRVMDDDDNDYVDEEEDNVSADEESMLLNWLLVGSLNCIL